MQRLSSILPQLYGLENGGGHSETILHKLKSFSSLICYVGILCVAKVLTGDKSGKVIRYTQGLESLEIRTSSNCFCPKMVRTDVKMCNFVFIIGY